MQKHLCIVRNAACYFRVVATFSLLMFALTSKAQVLIPPNPSTSTLLVANTVADVINCDMLTTTSGPLRAFSWDNAPNGVIIKIIDNTGGTAIINISNANSADIALADDLNGPPGQNYILGVVYQNTMNAYWQTYKITGVGTSSPLGIIAGVPIMVNTPGSTTSPLSEHVDMFADPNMLINGLPSMHRFIICWTEHNAGLYTVFAAYGDIATPSAYTSATVASGINPINADVAASYNTLLATNFGYLGISNQNTTSLDIAQLNCSSNIVTSNVLINQLPRLPRIEAMGVYNSSVSNNPWTIVASFLAGMLSNVRMFDATNLSGVNCSAPLFSSKTNWQSAVASGIGLPISGFSNQNYTIGWNVKEDNIFVSRAVNYVTGNISTIYPNYYQANLAPVPPTSTKSLYALSSASNSGQGLLTAWSDLGSNMIFYKLTNDVASYKPTNIEEIDPSSYVLYPNPAQNQLILKTDHNDYLKHIGIYSVLGRLVYALDASGTSAVINTATFPNGLYQVVIDTDKGQVIKKLEIVK